MLVILNFVKIWKVGRVEQIIVDKMIGVSMSLFLIASVLSSISIRSQTKTEVYEKSAHVVFLIGLASMTIIATFCTFEII